MIQPNGPIMEITGGPAAVLVAAYLWSWLWTRRVGRRSAPRGGSFCTQLPPHTLVLRSCVIVLVHLASGQALSTNS